jgi:hypothetical protein
MGLGGAEDLPHARKSEPRQCKSQAMGMIKEMVSAVMGDAREFAGDSNGCTNLRIIRTRRVL